MVAHNLLHGSGRAVLPHPTLASRQYLMGSTFTVADAYAFTIVNWTNFVGIDFKAYPKLGAYLARVGGRPTVDEALKAEGWRNRL